VEPFTPAPRHAEPDRADVTARRHGGNPESVAAYAGTAATYRGEQLRTVVAFVAGMGERGATCDEAEIELVLAHQACSARITEAKRDGLIAENGRRRPTRTGRLAAVYVAERISA
jgi:hypothetical protein